MGQYYKPVCLSDNKKNVIGFIYSHDLGEGLKLMEHSYIENKLMRCVEALLIPGGAWHKKPIVWAGDYAEPEEHTGENLYGMADGAQRDGEGVSIKFLPKPLSVAQSKLHRYIINHSKKEYVDKQDVPSYNGGWKIHPLSIMTAEGNGQGGGDFFGKDPKGLVGKWARDIISVEKSVPSGYKKILFNLTR
ncbi:MAG: hypothetical protein KatS3mg035_0990 [Bacteroidia bacterium]|nr:MAG: hypothetical protein KatS3mg035_0990 [Bacteroidia bacterium]